MAGGDSDVGIGGGALGSLTRLEPGYSPYRWHIEFGALITFKPPADDGWRVPYQDYYLSLVVPDLVRDKLRLEIRPSYTRETTQLYYGIGNRAAAPEQGPGGEGEADYFQYGRMHPTLLVRLRLTLAKDFFLLLGNSFTMNQIDVHPGSKLDQDLRSDDPRIRRFFGETRPHSVDFFEYALIYDSRDNETTPHRGRYHQAKLRLSPGGSEEFPYRYGQVNVIARFYVTPVRRWLGLGVRFVGDLQFGDPPFYELARYEDTFALGGVNGVRGVPAQRYYGKVKIFGNLETHSELVSFHLGANEYTVALATFFDAGRLWSELPGDAELDGRTLGLKFGVGGGLRLQQGKAFVVRGDVAWSPDARPVAAYFTAGQVF
jgi:hypothetical protein